jgi:hypothetical protein
MKVVQITIQEDASSWSAIVDFEDVIYAATYINQVVNVFRVPYKHPPKKNNKAIPTIKKWAIAEVANLSTEWHLAHNNLYSE